MKTSELASSWSTNAFSGSAELMSDVGEYHRTVLSRLRSLGLELPRNLPAPAGSYDPYRLHRGTGYLAAQTPGYDVHLGRIGAELSAEEGQLAARQAALHALGRIDEALGGFDRLVGLLHVSGHVASAETFLAHPKVLDGASLLFTTVLGDRGRHSRTAYGAVRLPHDVSIELEITFAYLE